MIGLDTAALSVGALWPLCIRKELQTVRITIGFNLNDDVLGLKKISCPYWKLVAVPAPLSASIPAGGFCTIVPSRCNKAPFTLGFVVLSPVIPAVPQQIPRSAGGAQGVVSSVSVSAALLCSVEQTSERAPFPIAPYCSLWRRNLM